MLIWVGAALLVVALAAGVVAGTLFWRALPTGVIDGDGAPGSEALAAGPVPGEVEVEVTGGEPYAVWSVTSPGGAAFDREDVTVACDGVEVAVSAAAVSGSSGAGTYSATTVAQVTAPDDGTCSVSVAAPTASGSGSFVVTEGWRFGSFFATIGGTILLWFVAVGGGMVGFGLLLGGIVWRVVGRR